MQREGTVDQITPDEYGRVAVRRAIIRDGALVPLRYVIEPGDSLDDEDPEVVAAAKAARKDARPLPVDPTV